MGLFGKRKKKKLNDTYDISDMDMQEILAEDEVNNQMFDEVSRIQYVNSQCEQSQTTILRKQKENTPPSLSI